MKRIYFDVTHRSENIANAVMEAMTHFNIEDDVSIEIPNEGWKKLESVKLQPVYYTEEGIIHNEIELVIDGRQIASFRCEERFIDVLELIETVIVYYDNIW